MGLLALLLIGLAAWLIWTGRLQRMSAKDGMALGAALVGAVAAAKGKPLVGAPLLIGATRSEEHTSELQSLMRISYAVFCLKKKKDQNEQPKSTTAKSNNLKKTTYITQRIK